MTTLYKSQSLLLEAATTHPHRQPVPVLQNQPMRTAGPTHQLTALPAMLPINTHSHSHMTASEQPEALSTAHTAHALTVLHPPTTRRRLAIRLAMRLAIRLLLAPRGSHALVLNHLQRGDLRLRRLLRRTAHRVLDHDLLVLLVHDHALLLLLLLALVHRRHRRTQERDAITTPHAHATHATSDNACPNRSIPSPPDPHLFGATS